VKLFGSEKKADKTDKALKHVIAALFEMERRTTSYTYGMSPDDLNETRDELEKLRQKLKK
jgi:hypothetical protein